MLHYAPQYVSSSMLFILRRNYCITTASVIVTLCKQPYSMRVESALHPHTVRLLTEVDDTIRCSDTIGLPEDEQRAVRNRLRSIVLNILFKNKFFLHKKFLHSILWLHMLLHTND